MRSYPLRWGLITSLLIVLVSYIFIFSPRTIVFSYAGNNCAPQLSLFPGILHTSESNRYKFTLKDEVRIGSFPLAARSICVSAKIAPTKVSAHINVSPFGWLLAQKTYAITAEDRPKVSIAPLRTPIPASKPVKLSLSTPDELSTYVLATDNAKSTCRSDDTVLKCDTKDLKLTQGQVQEVSLQRYFAGELTDVIMKSDVEVLSAVGIKDTSIQSDQTVYDKPSTFTLELDKPLLSAKATLEKIEGEAGSVIDTKVTVSGAVVTITPTGEMIRPAKYKLSLTSAEATDGSGLNEPLLIPFNLSDGPQVSSVSVGASSVDSNAVISLTFDQPLKVGQDITKFVSVAGVPVVVSQTSANAVRIALQGAGRCVDFSILVKKGLISDHEVPTTRDWQFSSRTRCSTVTTIGRSVQGRAINAYYFGSGSTVVLFTGAIHGSELSSKYIMDSWVAYLEEHAREIPSDRQIVVVPSVNPDGVAVASRYNAHNVNLNRNFSTSNWVSDIQVSGGMEKGGGGSAALSEPETAALAAFTQRIQPRFVVTYHSQGALVNSNDVGIAATLGPRYASMAGYGFVASSATTETFGFEMSGTYEDWLAEQGTPAILIELPTHTGQFFSRNTSAMWAMVRE